MLQFDEVGLVLDLERRGEPSGERGIGGADVNANLADRRMGQKAAPQQGMVLSLDGAARAQAFHPLGAAAAGTVQAQPMAARLQPALYSATLRGVGVGAGHIGDQQSADR